MPKYSNPGGVTYSDEVVREPGVQCPPQRTISASSGITPIPFITSMTMWLIRISYSTSPMPVVEAGNPNRYFKFGSTSKVTLPGTGISAMAASPENIADIKARMGVQTIGHDKINQLRHVQVLEGRRWASLSTWQSMPLSFVRSSSWCSTDLDATGCPREQAAEARGRNPRGGYFVSFDAPEGTAKRIVSAGKGCRRDHDGRRRNVSLQERSRVTRNIRIAPTLPPLEELDQAMKVFVTCVKACCGRKVAGGLSQQRKLLTSKRKGKKLESPLLLLKGLASCGSFLRSEPCSVTKDCRQ